MPLIGFSIQSTDIPALNGHYKLGADINITSLGVEIGDKFSVILDDTQSYDLGSYSFGNDDDTILLIEYSDDYSYIICTFNNISDKYDIPLVVERIDNSEQVTVFNLING